MGLTLLDDTWTRRGITILWDADSLNRLCKPNQVISMRRFFRLFEENWPEDDLPMVRDQALVVAGLESCIDALKPDGAIDWLEDSLYRGVLSYQQEVADGGGGAALVLWLTEQRRLEYQTSDDIYYWHCGTEYKGRKIPLSQCIFNGAYRDLRQIHVVGQNGKEFWVGLYHPRIS